VEVQWKDLLGNTNSTIRTVGAHQKHVTQGTLGADVACSTCHAVPSTVAATGHLGSDSKAEVRFDTTLSMYRSNAIYNASNVSCANTYCHGNFNGGNLNRTMTWTDTSSTAVACGTCHGDATKSTTKEKAFPVSGHTFVSVTADCSSCHGAVVNASMAIINPSKHINGKID
jgi:predicted CxxxxCH...CXXCH cytochrome family protein